MTTINRKGETVCSRCGLVIETNMFNEEMLFDDRFDHAPSRFDKVKTMMWKQAHAHDYHLQQLIENRFGKKYPKGFHHCLECGLRVSNLYPEKHVCTFESTKDKEWKKIAVEMFKSVKSVEEIAIELRKKKATVEHMLKQEGLLQLTGFGRTVCKKCGAIIPVRWTIHRGHNSKKSPLHTCGKDDMISKPTIDQNEPCYLSELGNCGGKCKKRIALSGKTISQELGIKYSNGNRYNQETISKLNDHSRFIVLCSRHAEKIKTIRMKHEDLSVDETIERIKSEVK